MHENLKENDLWSFSFKFSCIHYSMLDTSINFSFVMVSKLSHISFNLNEMVANAFSFVNLDVSCSAINRNSSSMANSMTYCKKSSRELFVSRRVGSLYSLSHINTKRHDVMMHTGVLCVILHKIVTSRMIVSLRLSK